MQIDGQIVGRHDVDRGTGRQAAAVEEPPRLDPRLRRPGETRDDRSGDPRRPGLAQASDERRQPALDGTLVVVEEDQKLAQGAGDADVAPARHAMVDGLAEKRRAGEALEQGVDPEGRWLRSPLTWL